MFIANSVRYSHDIFIMNRHRRTYSTHSVQQRNDKFESKGKTDYTDL